MLLILPTKQLQIISYNTKVKKLLILTLRNTLVLVMKGDGVMKITEIRSDKVYNKIINAKLDKKDDIYRYDYYASIIK